MNVKRALCASVLLLAGAVPGGCRYSTGDALPPEIRTIAVARLRNETATPGIEAETTEAVMTALLSQARLEVVGLGDNPDLVLTGVVDGFTRHPHRTDKYGDPVEFMVEVRATVWVRRADGEYLMKKAKVSNREVEPTSGMVRMTAGQSEAVGRTEAVEDLGRNIVRRILNCGW